MRSVKLYLMKTADSAASRHEAGRALLRRALTEAGLSAELPVRQGERGKPFVEAEKPFHFSISHCGEIAVCAVSALPVGVDIERERPLKQDIRRQLCAPGEDCAEDSALFDLWVGKEALGKADGRGFGIGFARTAVGFAADCTVFCAGKPYRLQRTAKDGWHFAICLQGEEPFEILV